MAKALALAAIRFYQRAISPRKGFHCAYAAHTGRGSCSALGYRAIQRYGVWRGLFLLDARLHRCGAAHRHSGARGALARQAGFLDCGGCDGPGDCHVGGANGALDVCGNCISCGDCGNCDWRRRRKKETEKYVVVSPATRLKR